MTNTVKEIEKQLDRWFAALKTGDPDQVTSLYARDAILLSTLKGDVKQGHRKIRRYFEKDFLPRHPSGTAVESHTRLMGRVAVNSGIYRFQVDGKDGGRISVEARFTFVYQWLENDWKIVEHHSSLNPEGQPTSAKKTRESRLASK